jgi:SAM-dependent methyltransferase
MKLLASPVDGSPLTAADGLLRGQEGLWPVLGGLPFLVPYAPVWLATHRDAVIAALAERGRLTAADLERLDAFATAVWNVAQAPIPDDFLEDEEASAALHDRLAALCEQGPVLEVGCGSGALTRRIRARPLVVVDRSPRALLRATADLDVTAVVGLAEALPVGERAFRTVVAANVIDLLDDPDAFLAGVADALRPGGRLVLCTPDPSLGVRNAPESALAELVEEHGFEVEEEDDGLRWSRVHSPRHREEYVVRLVVARRRR